MRNNKTRFLHEFFKNPTSTQADLATKLDISQATLSKYKEYYKEKNIIQADKLVNDAILGTRIQSEVASIPFFRAMDLDILVIRMTGIKGYDVLASIKSSLDLPFKILDGEIVTPSWGYLLIIAVNREDIDQIKNVLRRIYQFNLCNDIQFLKLRDCMYSPPNIQYWDDNLRKWTYDPNSETFGDDLQTDFTNRFIDTANHTQQNIVFDEFDDLDIELIRELEINAHVKLKNLEPFYDRDISTLSRRINNIRENLIKRYRVRYDHDFFELVPVMMIGELNNQELETFKAMISDQRFIFESFYFSSDTEFVWMMYCDIHLFSEIHELLSKFSTTLETYYLNDARFHTFTNPHYMKLTRDHDKTNNAIHDKISEKINHLIINTSENNISDMLNKSSQEILSDIDIDFSLMRQIENKALDFIDLIDFLINERRPLHMIDKTYLQTKIRIQSIDDILFYKSLISMIDMDQESKIILQRTLEIIEHQLPNIEWNEID